VINLAQLADWPGEEDVTPEALLKAGKVESIANGVKLLGNGEATKPLTVRVNAVSESARAKVVAAGGKIELIK